MLSHNELKRAIRNKYPWSHWILMEEVRDASGFEGKRSIDAVAFGLYASRGYEIHAFECKASRADWLKELSQPDKADGFAQMVDKFWIVANADVVKKEELPINWGLITASVNGDGFKTRISKQAAPVECADPLPRPFVASMLTRLRKDINQYKRESVLNSEIKDRLDLAFERGKENALRKAGWDVDSFTRLKEQVEAFEKASGVHIGEYNSGSDLGQKVALVESLSRQSGWNSFMHVTENMARDLSNISEEILKKVKVLDKKRQMLIEFKNPNDN